jgi:dihydroorotate dehydrogenase electron transfer subunit
LKFHVPNAAIVSQVQTGENIYTLTISSPDIAREAQPGQFAHLRCGNSADPLLRRPLSINDVERDKGWVTFSYQVVGKGTQLLSELKAGETLDVIGPLGQGFKTDFSGKKIGLIGGGMGIAPLIFLGRELSQRKCSYRPSGEAEVKSYCPLLLQRVEFPYAIATEDGSSGRKGLVTEILLEQLSQDTQGTQDTEEGFDYLFACGPKPMLAAVARLAPKVQYSFTAFIRVGNGLWCRCLPGLYDKGKEAW